MAVGVELVATYEAGVVRPGDGKAEYCFELALRQAAENEGQGPPRQGGGVGREPLHRFRLRYSAAKALDGALRRQSGVQLPRFPSSYPLRDMTTLPNRTLRCEQLRAYLAAALLTRAGVWEVGAVRTALGLDARSSSLRGPDRDREEGNQRERAVDQEVWLRHLQGKGQARACGSGLDALRPLLLQRMPDESVQRRWKRAE